MKEYLIGVDARPIESNPSGIGKLLIQTINALLTYDDRIKFRLFSHLQVDTGHFVSPTRVHVVPVRCNKHLFDLFVPFYLRHYPLDIYYGANQSVPLWGVKKRIVLICDMTPFVMPRLYSWKWHVYFKFWISISVKLADQVIAISQHTKDDISRILHANENKISVVYPWYEPPSGSDARPKAPSVLSALKVKKPFILFVGTLKKRKNIARLVEAFKSLVSEDKLDLELVLAGRLASGSEAVELPRDADLFTRVHVLGYVNNGDLQTLYEKAEALAYPSLYEGFGIPLLEAMAHGLPIVTSNVGVMKEVVGDAGVLVDPYDANSIAEGLRKVLTSEHLRNSMAESGYKRLVSFEKDHAIEALHKILLER
jgi:glycosyltransferase involved in cell wall biosynthesis